MTTTILFWAVSIALSLYLITYHIFNPNRRDAVLRRLRRGGVSSPDQVLITPSPEKEQQQHPLSRPLASSASDIATTFPPSQRDRLRAILPDLSPAQREALGDISLFDQDKFEGSLLRLDEDYRTADDAKYVYSGFSVREVKALGDFPDYAALSGVPSPKPYPEFDIDRARARPYRPWRWPYHQTMALSKLEPDWWLELESSYRERIAQRKELYAKHGSVISQWAPGSELACKELMEMCLQFVCARYPQYFALTTDENENENNKGTGKDPGKDKGQGQGKIWLENKILGVRADVRAKHPLLVLLDHIPEDFALMLRDPDTGIYVLRAGTICSALGWSLGAKFGLKLHEIHGPVPDYKEKMQFSMDRYFSKLPADKPIQRASWDFAVGQLLFAAPGDAQHEAYRRTQDKSLTPARVTLRVDRQTLRRLPLSGAVAFNFKAVFTPLVDLRREPYVPSLALHVLRCGNEGILKYKNTWHTEHVVIPALEEYEREQIENGVIERDWEPKTLEDSPYYPGWEDKWHAQQGF